MNDFFEEYGQIVIYIIVAAGGMIFFAFMLEFFIEFGAQFIDSLA